MKLIRKITALLATFAIITGMTVPARAAGITWTEIYNREQSQGEGKEEKITTLYKGDLSLEKGDSYRFTWEGTWFHGGIGGGTVYVGDGKTDVQLFYRNGSENGPINGNIPMSEADANPKPFKFVMLFDYTGKTPKAKIDVYDIDKTTLAGTIDVDISALSGITKIYHEMWNSNVTVYERPYTGSCIMEADASRIAIPSVADTDDCYEENGTLRAEEAGVTARYHDLFEGDLDGDTTYEILWKTGFYKGGGVEAGTLYLSDGKNNVALFSKAVNANVFDGKYTFATLKDSGNPDSVAFKITVDFAEKQAYIKFYDDTNCADNMLLGQSTVSIASLEGIKGIYYQMPKYNNYTEPQSSSVKIQKSVIRPKVRSVKLVTDGKAQTIYGDGAIDPKKTPVAPTFDKILIDMNTDVDLELLAEEVSLTATGSEENMLSGFTQKNYVATGAVDPDELLENTAYTLTLGGGITTADGKYTIKEPFSLSFKTGKRSMTGEITGATIADGKITADVSLVNSADAPKAWSFIVSCFDASGRMLWCGAASGDEKVSDGLDTSAEVELPDGVLPEGTATVKAYLWDNPIPTEIYSDGTEIVK